MATSQQTAPATFLQPVFGTMERDDPHSLYDDTKLALEAGFRHFDLAEIYKTQENVGRALAEAEIPRSGLWLTHKLDGMPTGEYELVRERVQAMLNVLNTDHVDLLLIHYPLPRGTDLTKDPAVLSSVENMVWFRENIGEAWMNMARLRAEGLTTHIGVSNFYAQHLDELAKHATLECPVYANEVFIDAAHPEQELLALLSDRGIHVLAYRPIVFVPNYAFLEGVTDQLKERAMTVGLSNPQELIMLWLLARGCAPVVSSCTPAHMVANAELPLVLEKLSPDVIGSLRDAIPLVDSLMGMREMVDMMGGNDEYAAAFASMGMNPSGQC